MFFPFLLLFFSHSLSFLPQQVYNQDDQMRNFTIEISKKKLNYFNVQVTHCIFFIA